jgi:hypothetical protein
MPIILLTQERGDPVLINVREPVPTCSYTPARLWPLWKGLSVKLAPL